MAALLLQSRFAGLKIEDDDNASSKQKPKKKPSAPAAGSSVKKSDPAKKKSTTAGKSQNAAPQKKKKQKSTATAQQWEQWKQKDSEMVDDNFEDELEQAILLSKLEFEEKKDVYKQHKKEADLEKKALDQAAKASTKKQKKKNTMSLEQFNDMVVGDDGKITNDDDNGSEGTADNDTDTQFFESVIDETRSELLKDKHYDRLRTRKTASDEVITRLQFADALERKDKEIDILKKEIQKLKAELLVVKSRNTKLCGILGQAEMKDKAEVLVEVERLREVQAELTAEVTSLHTDLEKERSRHPDPKSKDKKKKGGSSEKEKEKEKEK